MYGQQILIHSEYAQWSRIFNRLGVGGGVGAFLAFRKPTFPQQTFEYGHVVPYKTGHFMDCYTFSSWGGGPGMGALGGPAWGQWFDIMKSNLRDHMSRRMLFQCLLQCHDELSITSSLECW